MEVRKDLNKIDKSPPMKDIINKFDYFTVKNVLTKHNNNGCLSNAYYALVQCRMLFMGT